MSILQIFCDDPSQTTVYDLERVCKLLVFPCDYEKYRVCGFVKLSLYLDIGHLFLKKCQSLLLESIIKWQMVQD